MPPRKMKAQLSPTEALDEIRRLLEREFRYVARGFRLDDSLNKTRSWREYHTVRSIRAQVQQILKRVS